MLFPRSQSSIKLSMQFWLLAIFLLIVFLTGGSSRLDVQSLIILQPASIIACGLAILTLRVEHLQKRFGLLTSLGLVVSLTALHILPLPTSFMVNGTNGTELSHIQAIAGVSESWQPFTQTPDKGWQALLAFATPVAILLFGMQLNRDELFRLLPMILGLGAISGLLGLLQIIGSPDSPLYIYRITNTGSAVGLFANRNHAAVLLASLFPMLLILVATQRAKSKQWNNTKLSAIGFAAVLIPLILVTGSRSGLLISFIGLLGGFLIYLSSGKAGKILEPRALKLNRWGVLAGAIVVVCLAFATMYFSRAVAIERFLVSGPEVTNRSDFWIVSNDIFWRYFPFGSGSGSFAEIYRVYEPTALLDSTYLNRAHNDWIEVGVTMGIPGLAVAVILICFYLRRTYSVWKMDGGRRSVIFSRMAGLNLAMLAVASMSDYPLRTPMFMGLLAILLLWFVEAGRKAEH